MRIKNQQWPTSTKADKIIDTAPILNEIKKKKKERKKERKQYLSWWPPKKRTS